MGFPFSSPLSIAISAIVTIIVVIVVFVGINVILAFSGGPGPCTAGNPPITVNAANAASFQEKWDAFDAVLDGGTAASESFTESEVTSRADEYIKNETDVDFKDVRICLHDGFGEATAKLGVAGLDVKVKISGTVDLTGGSPDAQIDDIEFGNVPGFITSAVEGIVEDAVDDALNDIELKHTYTPTLSEGSAQIDGVP